MDICAQINVSAVRPHLHFRLVFKVQIKSYWDFFLVGDKMCEITVNDL